MRRRSLLQGSAAVIASGGAALALQAWLRRSAAVEMSPPSSPYGPLAPVADDSTGLTLLRLPSGFRYLSYGWATDPLRDGTPTPAFHDGMAVVGTTASQVILVRNHELRGTGTAVGKAPEIVYDAKALGGTTNLLFDTLQGRWRESWLSLSGTSTNCAGGPTPWGTWLTCEETLVGPADGYRATHGWVFEVPGAPEQQAMPVPIQDMGRFLHEAVAVDPVTGYLYETEDRARAGLYRFMPREPGRLHAGGQLHMLKIRGGLRSDLSRLGEVGTRFDTEWVEIANPQLAHTPDTTDHGGVFGQGWHLGGAVFARLEGCWYDRNKIYFVSTSGGETQTGQVWEYDPRGEQLRLLFASQRGAILNHPDNITVSPRGGLLLCEDGGGGFGAAGGNRLLGLSPDGTIFPFAENNIVLTGASVGRGFRGNFRASEWAGATFDTSGRWLFVNIQTPGITFAITGPWQQGAL